MTSPVEEVQINGSAAAPRAAKVDFKFEVVVIPVSDVDRSKQFYAKLGWRFDIDSGVNKDYRLVQFTPPGSSCSIIFGKNVTAAAPGSAQGLYLVVNNIEAACEELLNLGVEFSGPFHGDTGLDQGSDQPFLFGRRRVSGPDPDHGSYRSYASFDMIPMGTAGSCRKSPRASQVTWTPQRRSSCQSMIWLLHCTARPYTFTLNIARR